MYDLTTIPYILAEAPHPSNCRGRRLGRASTAGQPQYHCPARQARPNHLEPEKNNQLNSIRRPISRCLSHMYNPSNSHASLRKRYSSSPIVADMQERLEAATNQEKLMHPSATLPQAWQIKKHLQRILPRR